MWYFQSSHTCKYTDKIKNIIDPEYRSMCFKTAHANRLSHLMLDFLETNNIQYSNEFTIIELHPNDEALTYVETVCVTDQNSAMLMRMWGFIPVNPIALIIGSEIVLV